VSSSAIWHEVECGGYAADLETWERLAAGCDGPILELGCGTGRVALHLARHGHEVWGVDSDPDLLTALDAAAGGLEVQTLCADIRAVTLDRAFELVIAPMQVIQMVGGPDGRRGVLRSAAAHLSPRGRFAAAVVELPTISADRATAALPDVRERDGWLYSSLPVAVVDDDGGLEIRRLRQAVSPDGELSEEEGIERLDALTPATLEDEAREFGLSATERLEILPEDGYLGSLVLVMERA
jgi:SAM-dependent methyltransferase